MNKRIILALLLFLPGFVSAENVSKDVSITILIPETVNASHNYTEILLLTNHDDEPGVNDNLKLNVYVNITSSEEIIMNWSSEKTINQFSKTGMGSLLVDEGNYTLCAYALPLNFYDYNISNNYVCANFSTYYLNNETQEEPPEKNETSNVCDCQLKIYSDKLIYTKGEKIIFTIYDCGNKSSFEKSVDYWVEDLFGDESKKKLTTTSKVSKSFTPSFEGEEKTFIIKASISECEQVSERFVSFKGDVPNKETFIEATPESKPNNGIISVELAGYRGNTGKTLISLWLQKDGKKYSEISKAYVLQKYSDFKLKVPVMTKTLDEGQHEYALIIEGLDQDISLPIILDFEKPVLKCEEKKQEGITSFYTRKRNFDGSATFFGKVSSDIPLRIFSSAEEKNITPLNGDFNVTISINHPNEIVGIEIDELNQKFVRLDLLQEQKQEENHEIITYAIPEKEEEKLEIITGNVVLPETDEIPKNDFRILYFAGAAVLGFVVFNKEARSFLIKKTNLFK